MSTCLSLRHLGAHYVFWNGPVEMALVYKFQDKGPMILLNHRGDGWKTLRRATQEDLSVLSDRILDEMKRRGKLRGTMAAEDRTKD